ncbi:hypothetical protein [Leptothoe sp. PORK10 BA2]|uniref:hypothetical protein n=1 Tax=Leptothoe sp. PORK10 BA2 TaxID=3110254 RepID=UPI002B1EBDF2|nr:hypothetical protein [Leptothoe sp. PORK10 BA2]MEA5462884.1 hypothetical protein [Leptothoe sp. PORK10 BA2]
MDSSSTHPSNSTSNTSMSSRQASTLEHSSQREAELLNLVRDLNECNDVLLAKVSQLEDSLERSQAALQAEIDRAGPSVADREIVQLVTELEQSNQSLQHYQLRSETLQTELNALRERSAQLEAEHTALLQQHTEQSQELWQSNTNCRDLRARLQRQQRYTLQFKAALEKCLTMSNESSHSAIAVDAAAMAMAMPKIDEIRPWESALGHGKLDPQLESMIRGVHGTQTAPVTTLDHEAEDQLWHDLARVMDPLDPSEPLPPASGMQEGATQGTSRLENTLDDSWSDSASQFTEPSPWLDEPSLSTPSHPTVIVLDDSVEGSSAANQQQDNLVESPGLSSQLSPQANEILNRLQATKTVAAADTYLPAMSVQSSPSPLVNPLKPQKRKGSLAAIDLPSFPRLSQPSSPAKV